MQNNKRFDPDLLNAKLGDTVVFVNDDRYAHHLYTETPGFEFNVRKQMPGDKHRINLDKRSKFEVRCAIHPRGFRRARQLSGGGARMLSPVTCARRGVPSEGAAPARLFQ